MFSVPDCVFCVFVCVCVCANTQHVLYVCVVARILPKYVWGHVEVARFYIGVRGFPERDI